MLRKLLALVVLVVMGMAAPNLASAGIVTFNFGPGGEFSGSGGVLSGTVVVTLDDLGASGSVKLKIDSNGLSLASEKITGLWLNYNEPGFNLAPADFAQNTGAPNNGIFVNDSRATESDSTFKADGDGFFNIYIDFNTGGPDSGIFNIDEVAEFTITKAGLTAADFDNQGSVGGSKGSYEAALRAQGLDGGRSGHFGPGGEMPEPASLAIWGLGLAAVGFVSARRLRRRA